MLDEPDEIDQIPSPAVLLVAWEREGMELLCEVLGYRIHREPGALESKELEHWIRQVLLERAHDDIGDAQVNLEMDELIAHQPTRDCEPEAAAGRAVEGAGGGAGFIREPVAKVGGESACQEDR